MQYISFIVHDVMGKASVVNISGEFYPYERQYGCNDINQWQITSWGWGNVLPN